MDEELLEQEEIDIVDFNQLTMLGNQAVKMGLILGHGHFKGQYEILCRHEVVLLPLGEAKAYLERLMAEGV
jgi:hypothetical protein